MLLLSLQKFLVTNISILFSFEVKIYLKLAHCLLVKTHEIGMISIVHYMKSRLRVISRHVLKSIKTFSDWFTYFGNVIK